MASNENSNKQIEPFKVYVRIRPFLPKELPQTTRKNSSVTLIDSKQNSQQKSVFIIEDNLLFLLDPTINNRKEKEYVFDGIFNEEHTNHSVFEKSIKPIIDNVIKGYNATALAYGVTGTGKTHTIFGDLSNQNFSEQGIIINSSDYLFSVINEASDSVFNVKVSYLEIYNETVIDLLNSHPVPLMIVEDSVRGVVVPDLKEFEVNNSTELLNLIIQGNSRRTMAPTNQNQFSSRSHAILQISLEQKKKVRDVKEEIIYSKFLVVDLAGSERGGLERGIRREEGANINKSLLSLGNCINILSDKSKAGNFVPYRDSKLTRLLKDSLGGNISTVMLACVSPSPMSYDDSVNTLNYATRARKIQKKIDRNVKEVSLHISQYKEIIDSLKAEISQLKDVIKNQQQQLEMKGEGSNKKQIIEEGKDGDISSIHGGGVNNSLFDIDEDQNILLNNNNNSFISVIPNTNGNYGNIMVNNKSFSKTAKTVQTMNVDMYKKFLEDEKNEDLNENITELQKQVENIKNDKIMLESYLENQPIKDDAITAKYSSLKFYYDKYIELLNDKLIENIEQNMILKCNMKEIGELNSTNIENLKILQKQIYTLSTQENNIENCAKLVEEVNNIKNAIEANENLKIKIHDSFSRNLKIKKLLKKILLNLLTSSKETGIKYFSVLKEKEELQETAKTYEKKLEKILTEHQKKNIELTKAQKEVEILRQKLLEKEQTIFELKKNQTKKDLSIRTNANFPQKIQRKKSTPLIGYGSSTRNKSSNNLRQIIQTRDRSKSANTKQQQERKIVMKKPFKKINQNYSTIISKNKNYNYSNMKTNIHKMTPYSSQKSFKQSETNKSNNESLSIVISNPQRGNRNEITILDEINNIAKTKLDANYSKYINVRGSNSKINLLQQARLENKMKTERAITPVKMNKAESFINEYLKTRQNETVISNNKNKVDSVTSSLIQIQTESNEDNVNLATQSGKNDKDSIINNSSDDESNANISRKFNNNHENQINTNTNMVTESPIQNPDDFFKSIAESLKNPRLTKYLDTSSSKQ